jgi:hypothetical protein
MQAIRFAASAAMTLLVLGLAALLWSPSFQMPATGAEIGLGRGALPQFCVVAGAIFAIAIFIRDVVHMRRTGSIQGPSSLSASADSKRVVVIGLAALLLLAAYVTAWAYFGFLLSSIAYLIVTSLVLLPFGHWQVRSIAIVAAVGVLFGVGVWALFVYVLQVPLR